MSVNGKEYEMRACSLLDLLDGASVRILFTSPGLQAYCLLPSFKFTNESMNGFKPGPESYFQDRLYLPVIHISKKESSALEIQLQAMERALSDVEHSYRQDLVRTYFKLFLLELGNITLKQQKGSMQSDTAFNRKDIITIDFLRLLWKHFRTERNIDFYAEKLHISPKHLSRTVKAVLGQSPHKIICKELVQYASSLLKENNLSILEISESLRFSEQAAFCKFFKKHTGVAPGQYRKNQQLH